MESFLVDQPERVKSILLDVDTLASNEQVYAWEYTIDILKSQLSGYEGMDVVLEYVLPRINTRIDTVLLYHGIVFVLEFKCGEKHYSEKAKNQVIDYTFNLHFCHESSKDRLIVPIVVATEASSKKNEILEDGRVIQPLLCNKSNLAENIDRIVVLYPNEPALNAKTWMNSFFNPTPTIIEAARYLYNHHTVEDIKKHDSTNLTDTISKVNQIIRKTKHEGSKAICFITGVPGAGKTLVGLTVAIDNSDENTGEHAAYLSGNGPLVDTLIEALARDVEQRDHVSRAKARSTAKSFIHKIFNFRQDGINDPNRCPPEQVVVFDEAQRSWTRKKLEDFVTSPNRGVNRLLSYEYSEPESLILQMNRRTDCAIIICLVGGGQEIYDGEAGLPEWFNALKKIPGWNVYATPELRDPVYLRGTKWSEMISGLDVEEVPELHLTVSMRTVRTDRLNSFVESLLSLDLKGATETYSKLGRRFPLVVTRDFDKAKKWVEDMATDHDRYGRLMSSLTKKVLDDSKGIIHKRGDKFDAPSWFLNTKGDPKSSYNLETYASEFDVQGLELDYSIVEWGPDLRFESNTWQFYKRWKGEWRSTGSMENGIDTLTVNQNYLLNSYRVLLTRGRKGMVIFIPEHYVDSPSVDYNEGVYRLLKSLGIDEI